VIYMSDDAEISDILYFHLYFLNMKN